VAAEAIVEDGAWLAVLRRELSARLAGVFAQARSRLTAFAYPRRAAGRARGPQVVVAVGGAGRACHAAADEGKAVLAIAAARPAPAGGNPPASATAQPAAWRDTGKLPATADDRPPGDDPGLVKVSVPEARRLARLATTPMSRAARNLGYAWSRWRRRHQARARWHHYHAQLKAAHVT
jgi:hypothetical protein